MNANLPPLPVQDADRQLRFYANANSRLARRLYCITALVCPFAPSAHIVRWALWLDREATGIEILLLLNSQRLNRLVERQHWIRIPRLR